MEYLHWNEITITDFSERNIGEMYEKGYVFTRIGRGVMQETRSIRIDLNKFKMSSENRRILKKTENIQIKTLTLPLTDYNYTIGKLAKDFYEKKFGPKIMSAQKIKEILTSPEKSNFNSLMEVIYSSSTIGYSICFRAQTFIHYSYPFYNLEIAPKDTGLGMMIRAIEYAQETGMKYIYLGSLQRSSDTYKLQFLGIEWFDGTTWSDDMEKVKFLIGKKE